MFIKGIKNKQTYKIYKNNKWKISKTKNYMQDNLDDKCSTKYLILTNIQHFQQQQQKWKN